MEVTHRLLTAQKRYCLIKWPCSIFVWLFRKSTAIVHAASELLNTEDTEQKENEHHESYSITERR